MAKYALIGTLGAVAILGAIYVLGWCGWQVVGWLAKFM